MQQVTELQENKLLLRKL